MPNAALIILASPLLLGEAPHPAPYIAVEPVVAAQSGPLQGPRVAGMIALEWSLGAAGAQPQEAGPREAEPDENPDGQDQSQTDPDGNPSDENRILVTGTYGPPKDDPIGQINEESYRITQQLDDVFVEPIAYAYRDGLPDPIRDGLGNVVRNLGEPNNALNFLLQGKFGKAFETLGRLLINTSLGFGGLIDLAEKPGIGLPYRRNGFGNTLGYYGVGPGPYLYLPLTGATTARDVIGSGLDQLLLPVAVGKPFNQFEFTAPYYVISNLDARLEVDAELGRIEETLDPYAARRDSYLYRRARDIALLKGEEPPEPPLIMEEVEGTGDFADPPQSGREPEAGTQDGAVPPAVRPTETSEATGSPSEPETPLIITRPR